MEYLFKVNAEELSTAIWKALVLGYKFLPHDRVISEASELESIRFMTLPDLILQRIALRQGQDWFHLVKDNWDYQEYSTTLIRNQYRGEMEVVDQRSWGPYVDLQVRRRTPSGKTDEFELTLHLYPRFWEPAQKRERQTPQQVKKDFSALRSAIAPSRKTSGSGKRKRDQQRSTGVSRVKPQ
jgi:hypothetical protein